MKTVKEFLKPIKEPAPFVKKNDPIIDIAQFVARYNFRWGIFVLDENEKLVGFIKLENLIRHLLREQSPRVGSVISTRHLIDILFSGSAEDIMSKNVPFVREEDNIKDAIDRMLEYNMKIMPVLDDKDRVVGFLDMSTIINYAIRNML